MIYIQRYDIDELHDDERVIYEYFGFGVWQQSILTLDGFLVEKS